MTKYAAHLIQVIRFREGLQDHFPYYENVVLIEADSDDAAFEMAAEYGRAEAADDDPSFRWGDRSAYWEFAGIRKLIECREACDLDDPVLARTELTYSQMSVRSEADLQKLVDGEAVEVVYQE